MKQSREYIFNIKFYGLKIELKTSFNIIYRPWYYIGYLRSFNIKKYGIDIV